MMTQYGDVNSSLAFQEVPKPTVGPGQVLIQTHATSLNPIDYKVLRGDLKALIKLQFPTGIGRDVSGVVVEIGSDVGTFQVGDAVFGRVDEPYVGTLAEFVVSEAQHIAKKPENLSHCEAASVPLVGLTSYQSMFDIAALKKGQKILIHAGSGGIGTMAIQLAKSVDAYVATTTSTANVPWVKDLGADQVIDYKTQDYLKEVRDFDVVFDTLGGQYTVDAFRVLRPGGTVVSIAGDLDPITTKELGLNFFIRFLLGLKARKITQAAKHKQAQYRMLLMSPNGSQLSTIADLYTTSTIKAIIDKVYDFDQSLEAFNYLVQGRAKGKVVVKLIT